MIDEAVRFFLSLWWIDDGVQVLYGLYGTVRNFQNIRSLLFVLWLDRTESNLPRTLMKSIQSLLAGFQILLDLFNNKTRLPLLTFQGFDYFSLDPWRLLATTGAVVGCCEPLHGWRRMRTGVLVFRPILQLTLTAAVHSQTGQTPTGSGLLTADHTAHPRSGGHGGAGRLLSLSVSVTDWLLYLLGMYDCTETEI